jgi:hypothetical protein
MDEHSDSPRRKERLVFETDRYLVTGDLTLPPEGYKSRVSDAINREDVDFLPLVDVVIEPLAGGDVVRRDFILLSKAHVRFAYPVDGGV